MKVTTINKKASRWNTIAATICISALYSWQPAFAESASTDLSALKAKYRRPTSVPFPKSNEYSPAREMLGKSLFFDPRLSGSQAISCASCHNPSFCWGDGLAKGVGHGSKQLGRRTPTILNMAWGELYFWDGRADSLEDQALGPIASAAEMNMPIEAMLASVKGIAGYHTMFEMAYPGEGISDKTVAKAIATFERTVVSGTAPFDEWVAGDEKAISETAKRGFVLFNGKSACFECHTGWNFTDDGFHDIGLAGDSRGRGEQLKDIASVQFAFKTPSLRNVAMRGPYMHDGSEKTLDDVVKFYNKGGNAKRESLAIHVKPLNLTEAEIKDLTDFMRTLNGRDKPTELPFLPR